jgi:hypothetical protein
MTFLKCRTLVERGSVKRGLDGIELLQKRTVKSGTEVGYRAFNPRPHVGAGARNERLSGGGERDETLALVARLTRGSDEPLFFKLRQSARDAGLRDAKRLRDVAYRERTMVIERGEDRQQAGRYVHPFGSRKTLHVGLHALSDTLQSAAKRQITKLADNVSDHHSLFTYLII